MSKENKYAFVRSLASEIYLKLGAMRARGDYSHLVRHVAERALIIRAVRGFIKYIGAYYLGIERHNLASAPNGAVEILRVTVTIGEKLDVVYDSLRALRIGNGKELDLINRCGIVGKERGVVKSLARLNVKDDLKTDIVRVLDYFTKRLVTLLYVSEIDALAHRYGNVSRRSVFLDEIQVVYIFFAL